MKDRNMVKKKLHHHHDHLILHLFSRACLLLSHRKKALSLAGLGCSDRSSPHSDTSGNKRSYSLACLDRICVHKSGSTEAEELTGKQGRKL